MLAKRDAVVVVVMNKRRDLCYIDDVLEDVQSSQIDDSVRPVIFFTKDGGVDLYCVVYITKAVFNRIERENGSLPREELSDCPFIDDSEKMLPKRVRRIIYEKMFCNGEISSIPEDLRKNKLVVIAENVFIESTKTKMRIFVMMSAMLIVALFFGGGIGYFANNLSDHGDGDQNSQAVSIELGEGQQVFVEVGSDNNQVSSAVGAMAESVGNHDSGNSAEVSDNAQIIDENESVDGGSADLAEEMFSELIERIVSCPVQPREGRGFNVRHEGSVAVYTHQHLIDVAYHAIGYNGPPETTEQWQRANDWLMRHTGHGMGYFAGSYNNRREAFTIDDVSGIVASSSIEDGSNGNLQLDEENNEDDTNNGTDLAGSGSSDMPNMHVINSVNNNLNDCGFMQIAA